jgi:hypothetical protein
MGKIVVKFGVYGDYGGCFPNTADLGIFDTQRLAEKAVELLNCDLLAASHDSTKVHIMKMCIGEDADKRMICIDLLYPYVKEYQHLLSFKIHEVLVQVGKVSEGMSVEKLVNAGLTPEVIYRLGLAVEDGRDEDEQRKIWGDATVDWINMCTPLVQYDEKLVLVPNWISK